VRPESIDTRWDLGDDARPVTIVGGQIYGNCAAPRQLLLDIGGFDEMCDSMGGEDYQLGMRLEATGATILYRRAMLTIESEELHRQQEPLSRVDPSLAPDAYMDRLRRFGVAQRATDGAFDCSHMVLDVVLNLRANEALGNHYVLRDLAPEALEETASTMPTHRWFDDKPIAEM
jgi:hypothetical protein